VAKDTFNMLADSGMKHLAPHALTALNNGYIKPSKRIFDNAAKIKDATTALNTAVTKIEGDNALTLEKLKLLLDNVTSQF
jgi:hypothetical protein